MPNKKPQSHNIELKSNFLGERGGILVVPGQQRRRRRNRKAREQPRNDAEKENEVPFMLSELGKQERSVGDETVERRIEGFRGSYQPNAELSNTEWEGLRSSIQSSFTGDQLQSYISDHEPRRRSQRTHEGALEWMPGTSAFLEDDWGAQAGVAHRLAASQSLKGKKLFAERILRDCWHLGIAAEIGQQDIHLPSHWISLFLNSENFSFEEIASLNGAKIDITHSLGLVRITGTKAVCAAINEIIDDATKRIREDDFEPYPEAGVKFGDAFAPDFLDWASRSYGVSFTLNPRNYPSKIFYLVENKRGADSARRTLNLATFKAPSIIPFCTYLSASEPARIYVVDPESKTSYFDRQKPWFRWAMSSTQSSEGATLNTPFFNAHQAHLSDVLLSLLRNDSFSTMRKGDAADTHESITAAVGRCLFMRKPTLKEGSVTASQLGEMSVPRTFTTDIPKTTSFLHSLELSPPEDDTQRHRIRLSPTALNADAFPELELELAVRETEDSSEPGNEITLHSAKAIMSENSVDFLLPENDLDLRFNRTMHYDLLNGANNTNLGDQGVESLEETMNKCLRGVISIDTGSAPQAPLPEFCHISLPKHVLKHGRHSTNNTAEPDNPDSYATAEYMFQPVSDARGTQVHRYDFHGQRLNYIFYESGPFFASHTTDLFVNMDLPPGDSQTSSGSSGPDEAAIQRDFNNFYNNACNLAFELHRAWQVA